LDSATLQARIYKGYGLAALRIGPVYSLYRPTSATNPISANTLLGTLNASFNAEDMTYTKPRGYAKATWYALLDGSLTKVGDYLIGDKTFFIAAQQDTLPILAVECTNTVNLLRPAQQSTVGAVGYGGDTAAGETMLMKQWPCSILQGTKGEKNEVNLPGDTRNPWWVVLLPYWSGVTLRTSDIITDDMSRRLVISSAEKTPLGWRLTAQQAQT